MNKQLFWTGFFAFTQFLYVGICVLGFIDLYRAYSTGYSRFWLKAGVQLLGGGVGIILNAQAEDSDDAPH